MKTDEKDFLSKYENFKNRDSFAQNKILIKNDNNSNKKLKFYFLHNIKVFYKEIF